MSVEADDAERELPDPDLVLAQVESDGPWLSPDAARVGVALSRPGTSLRVDVAAGAGVSRVVLRWDRPMPTEALIVGDAWERSYGELQWCSWKPERPLPWLFLVHDRASGSSWGAGVEVRGGAFAFWTADAKGFSLWLDLRSGDSPVVPGSRAVHAATVRAVATEERPWVAQAQLTALLCRDPILPPQPLVGANNWYYAYGKNFDSAAVLRDARTVAELAGDHPVRPFSVVDDGWTADGIAEGRPASAGPWDRVRTPAFGDMAEFAAAVRAEGCRPGIWYRPLLVATPPAGGLRVPRAGAYALDLSHPATLESVATDVARLAGWGFELIKHDYSTYDYLGRWGSAMAASVTVGGWQPADTTVTNAEAIVRFYRTILGAAGHALVLGCNVVGHLAAGLTHVQRIGDDTSGREWGRTRRVGVNTLAFRLAQHNRFFAVDADCVPSTLETDWSKNRQFLDLIARSGTALFVSVDPASRSDRVDADLAAAIRLTLDGGAPGGVEPLDWLDSTTPERWRDAGGEITYDWLGPAGADPFEA